MSVGEKTEKLIRSAWQDHPSEEWRNAYLCGLLDGVLLGQEVLQVDKVAGIQENCCGGSLQGVPPFYEGPGSRSTRDPGRIKQGGL